MLQWMREKAPAIMAVAIIAFVATIFVSWGAGGVDVFMSGQRVGSIDGQKVTINEFDAFFRANYSSEIPEEDQRRLPEELWKLYVYHRVFEKAVDDMRLHALNREVSDFILANPRQDFVNFLQSMGYPIVSPNGTLDTAAYGAALLDPNVLGMPQFAEYLSMVERELKEQLIPREKLARILTLGKTPSPIELEAEYRRRNERAVFRYISANPAAVSADDINVTDEMVREYYRVNRSDFSGDRRATCSYIKIHKIVTRDDEYVIINDLNQIREDIVRGHATFAEEVRAVSDNIRSMNNDGFFGIVQRGIPEIAAIEDQLFALQEGEISEPIRFRNSYHLFHVDNRTEDELTLGHIEKFITLSPNSEVRYATFAQGLIEELRSSSIEEVAKTHGLTFGSTGFFGYGDSISIPYNRDLHSFAFTGDAGDLNEFHIGDDYIYIVRLDDSVERGTLTLSQATPAIQKILEDSLRVKKAGDILGELISSITEDSDIDSIVSSSSILRSAVTDSVTRAQWRQDPAVIGAVFRGELNRFSSVIESNNYLYAVKPIWRESIQDISAEKLTELKEALRAEAHSVAQEEWLLGAKEDYRVTDQIRQFYY